MILLGVAGIVAMGAFVMLLNLGDRAQPERQEVRVELKDAFKD